jgi:hypothetical protein
MLKTIEERLLAAPVRSVSPVSDELSQIRRADPSVPIVGGVSGSRATGATQILRIASVIAISNGSGNWPFPLLG